MRFGHERREAKQEVTLMITYLTYRVQYALYQLERAREADLDWQTFVERMKQSEELRAAAKAVVFHAMDRFSFTGFLLDARQEPVESEIPEGDGDEIIRMAILFSPLDRRRLLEQLMRHVKESQYAYLRKDRGQGYTWRDYRHDLKTDWTVLAQMGDILWHALRTMDFKAS